MGLFIGGKRVYACRSKSGIRRCLSRLATLCQLRTTDHDDENIHGEVRQRPNVNVIHAGLECGIIQANAGHKLDIVSFGPTITGAHSPDEAVHIAAVGKSYDYLLAILEQMK